MKDFRQIRENLIELLEGLDDGSISNTENRVPPGDSLADKPEKKASDINEIINDFGNRQRD